MRGYESSMPLFDRPASAGLVPCNSTVVPDDVPRLSDQHTAILKALTDGPKTNLQLGMICQRFGARLHELKRAGHPWLRERVDKGVYEYRLLGDTR